MKLKFIILSGLAASLFCGGARGAEGVPSLAPTTPVSPESYQQHSPAFEEMLAHVYWENPQLNTERDNLRLLDEGVSTAAAGFRPQLALTGALGEARVSENSEPWHYGTDRNVALVATQPLYNGAANGQWHAAQKRVMEGRARLLATEQKVLLAAISAWLEMSGRDQLVVLNRDNARLTQKYLESTRQRLSAGDGTQTDVAVAESRAAEGDIHYAMAVAARDAARAAYTRATGLPPQMSELPPLPASMPQSEEEAAGLAKANPDMQQADYEVAATADDVDSAIGARQPYLYLRGSVSDESDEELGLAHLRDDSITINVSFPLYAGGGEYARERAAKIAHEKSRFDSMAVSRAVSEEAAQSWSRFRAAQTVIEASSRAAEAADRALADIGEEQKHGARTVTEVLDAQTQALNARITALQAEIDLRLNAYRLMAATGRLTARGLNLPTAVYNPVIHYDDVASRWFGTSIGENKD